MRCPGCGSLERHRATWLYLTTIARILDGPRRLLDVAPAPFITAALNRAPDLDYLSIDLESPLAMRRMDVTRLDLPDDAFDVLLCSHVLEHVPDDRLAMRELRRVLRSGGFAILQTPWDPRLETTDEDPDAGEEERRADSDRRTMSGRTGGICSTGSRSGWQVELIDPGITFGDDSVARYGLDVDDPLIVGR